MMMLFIKPSCVAAAMPILLHFPRRSRQSVVISDVRELDLTSPIDQAWREAERIVEAHPVPEMRRWFETFSRMDGLLRQIAELPFVQDDPTANRIMESFATCETMDDLSDRIDLLLDHVRSLFHAKLIAEGRDPSSISRPRRGGAVPRERGDIPDTDADERPSRTVLKL